MKPERSGQNGNILFLILLAVVLFAALAYAVTSSMRGGGKDAGNEKVSTQAASLMNYFAEINSGVQRMMLVNDVKDYQVNFYYQSAHNFIYGANDNTNCTESRCRVFDPAGGGVTGRDMKPYTRNAALPDPERIYYAQVPHVGDNRAEVIFTVHGVSKELCLEINAKSGLSDAIFANINGGSGPIYQNAVAAGAINDAGYLPSTLPLNAALNGTFCVASAVANWDQCLASVYCPAIFHVVIPR